MTFHIRPAKPADLDAILTLERATPTAPHWPPSDYQKILDPPPESGIIRRLFIAESLPHHALLGFAAGKLLADPNQNSNSSPHSEAELESVAVSPSARRHGVATALCRAVIVWASAHNTPEIDLEVRSNSTAVFLYQKLGFVPQGRRPAYYRDPIEDATCMRLDLRNLPNPAS